jgi:hypothetical protein
VWESGVRVEWRKEREPGQIPLLVAVEKERFVMGSSCVVWWSRIVMNETVTVSSCEEKKRLRIDPFISRRKDVAASQSEIASRKIDPSSPKGAFEHDCITLDRALPSSCA